MVHHGTTTLHFIPHRQTFTIHRNTNQGDNDCCWRGCFGKALAILPPLLIFRRILKCFDTVLWFFWVLAVNSRWHIYADLFNSSFFICYFAGPRPNLGHCKEDNLNHQMLITALLSFFWLKGPWEPQKNEFLKTWNVLQTNPQIHRPNDA